jgi:heat shock protein HslJ
MTSGSGLSDVLAGRTFELESLGGTPALEAPTAVLTFGRDGRIHGRATINRVNGSYRVDGDELLCGPMASTMMAGLPEAMDQEHRLLTALGGPSVLRVVEDGIELVATDGAVTVLREIDGEDELA